MPEETKQNPEFIPYEKWIFEAFQVHQEHTLRKATLHILQDAARADSDSLCNPNLTDAQRHFMAGRLATSKELFDLFNNIFTEANKREERPS